MKRFLKFNNTQSGIALLLTMIITSAALLIAVLISNVVTTQIKLSSDIRDSTLAIYAADSGIEWELYQIRQGAAVPAPVMANGATIITIVSGSAPNFTIKSLGSFGTVKRQFEVSF
jgi:Tfp pilus assembly protein PilX